MADRLARRGFGKSRYLMAGKERPHISRSKLLANDSTEFLKLGEQRLVPYGGWEGQRYVAAEGLTYDFLMTFYDVNSPRAFAARLFDAREVDRTIRKGLKAVESARPNVEARIIGLQNDEEHVFLKHVVDFLVKKGVRLIEIDLFGGDIRHVALDLKTGASYNILMEDRSYRPGELINPMTPDDFSRTLIRAKA
jgi:hypothetical protein